MVNVIGLGYIGLPTFLMLAANGVKATGTDINTNALKNIEAKIKQSKEPKFLDLYNAAFDKGFDLSPTPVPSELYIVSVPTPVKEGKDGYSIDASLVEDAVKSILEICPDNATIVIESTVAPNTIEQINSNLISKANKGIKVAHAPERVIPGKIVDELANNDRVIGADTPETCELVKKVYSSFVKGTIFTTDIKTAEIIKLAENSYRAVNIAYANELAKICRAERVDVDKVIEIANHHPRVDILSPGPGVGGHCLPVDPWFLIDGHEAYAGTIENALRTNDSMPEYLFNIIKDEIKSRGISDLSRVGIYGLSYKADVDDFRNSPAIHLVELEPLFKSFDPMAHSKVLENQILNFEEFISSIELMVVLVNHAHFEQVKSSISVPVIEYTSLFKPISKL